MRLPEPPPLRVTLGPSRLAAVLWLAAGVGAAVSVVLSDVPLPWAIPAALACVAWGMWIARDERQRATRVLVVATARDGGGVPVVLDGVAMRWVATAWRGPLCVLALTRDGRTERVVAWPDVLSADARRELRLRMPRGTTVAAPASVAP